MVALDFFFGVFDRVFLLCFAFVGWAVAGAFFIALELVLPRVCG